MRIIFEFVINLQQVQPHGQEGRTLKLIRGQKDKAKWHQEEGHKERR